MKQENASNLKILKKKEIKQYAKEITAAFDFIS